MYDGNLQAADFYHAQICSQEHAYMAMLKEFPPTCSVCEHANISPDGAWCWCNEHEEWFGSEKWCDDEDFFEPTRSWEAFQQEWPL